MNLIDIFKKYNIPYKTEGHHHCTPNHVQTDCPFCAKDSHKWHLGWSLEHKGISCWRCGSHKPTETLVEITGKSHNECRKLLTNIEPIKKIERKEKPKGKLIIPKGLTGLSRPHKRYLKKRGFNWKEIRELWQIAGIGLTSHLSWRIFIPIIYHGKIVSWTTRSISNSPNVTRYISAAPKEESMNHKNLLYGEDYARQTIIITEGCFDVWRIGLGAVATLGTGYTNEQAFRMTSYPKRVICFDNEKEAQIRAKKLCDNLSVFPGETFNVQLDAKDPAEASNREIRLLRESFLK